MVRDYLIGETLAHGARAGRVHDEYEEFADMLNDQERGDGTEQAVWRRGVLKQPEQDHDDAHDVVHPLD